MAATVREAIRELMAQTMATMRPAAMSAAFRCRLVESQLTVIDWALKSLS